MFYRGRQQVRDILSDPLTPIVADPCVVTIGTFDGMHQGHRAVVSAARKLADTRGQKAVAVTFDPRPEVVLQPDRALPNIMTLKTRIRSLRAAGMDDVVVLRFSRQLARLPADMFIRRLRVLTAMDVLCVGADFALGRDKSLDVAAIAAMGFDVVAVPLVNSVQASGKASSTNVRQAIASGIDRNQAMAFA